LKSLNILLLAIKEHVRYKVNPIHHGFGLGWIEIFLQISIGLIFDPTYLEPAHSD